MAEKLESLFNNKMTRTFRPHTLGVWKSLRHRIPLREPNPGQNPIPLIRFKGCLNKSSVVTRWLNIQYSQVQLNSSIDSAIWIIGSSKPIMQRCWCQPRTLNKGQFQSNPFNNCLTNYIHIWISISAQLSKYIIVKSFDSSTNSYQIQTFGSR